MCVLFVYFILIIYWNFDRVLSCVEYNSLCLYCFCDDLCEEWRVDECVFGLIVMFGLGVIIVVNNIGECYGRDGYLL